MAFTHTLYYPWIDIENTDWLKTAILYWDKISTIVPGYMEESYNTAEGAFLKQENILIPERVHWWDFAVQDASRSRAALEKRERRLPKRPRDGIILMERDFKGAGVGYFRYTSDTLVEWLCDYGESFRRVIGWMLLLLFVIGPFLFRNLGGVQWNKELHDEYFIPSPLGKE